MILLSEKDTKIESLFLFFMSIYLFDDFYFIEDRVFLKLRENTNSKSIRDLLSWFLNSINQNYNSEFFLISVKGEESLIELKCNSQPEIFEKMLPFLKKMLSVENGAQY